MSNSSTNGEAPDAKGTITDCPVCSQPMTDPRSLPCVHTVCLKCIDACDIGRRTTTDMLPCPVCAREFAVPVSGLAGLPKNLFIRNLLIAKRCNGKSLLSCEVCSSTGGRADAKQNVADSFCVECDEKLCESCAEVHRNSKMLRGHALLKLDVVNGKACGLDHLSRWLFGLCKDHPNEALDVFCCTCGLPVCSTCCATSHVGHKRSDDGNVVEELRQQITAEAGDLDGVVDRLGTHARDVERQKCDLAERVAEAEKMIVGRAAMLTELIESGKRDLLGELASRAQEFERQLDATRDEISKRIAFVQDLRKYGEELLARGSAVDVARESSALHERVDELVRCTVISRTRDERHSIKVQFRESTSMTPADCVNVVGDVDVQFVAKECKPTEPTLTHVIPRVAEDKANYVVGLTTLGSRLFVLRCDPRQQIEVYDTNTFALLRQLSLASSKVTVDETYGLAACSVNNCLYLSDFKHFSVHRIELAGGNNGNFPVVTSWSVALEPAGLHVNRASNVLVTCRGAQRLQEYTTVGSLVREINLPSDLPSPWCAIDLAGGRFAVSCGNRVCVVEADGRVATVYGSPPAASGQAQLGFPVGLAETTTGNVLVANRNNNCVTIVNSRFNGARDLAVSIGRRPLRPWAICLDESRGRLYVGEYEGGRVLVFDDVCDFVDAE